MTTRRTNPKNEQATPQINLSELLQDDSNTIGPSFGDTDGLAIRRLNHVVGELGGMVTYWVDHTNQRLCFSVRIGSEKRPYQAESVEQFNQQCEQFTSRLAPALKRLGKKPPPPLA